MALPNFFLSLRGTSQETIRLGETGPQLKNLIGVIQARNQGDSAFSILQSSLNKDEFGAALFRISNTVARLQKHPSRNGYVEVNGTIIDVSGNKDVTVGTVAPDNLIEGGAPAASTLYNMYLSSAGNLRLSATAKDANGYRTGDATNRFVGAIWLDASKELAENQNICGIKSGIDTFFKYFTTITRSSGVAGYYEIHRIPKVVCLDTTDLLVIGQTYRNEYNVSGVESEIKLSSDFSADWTDQIVAIVSASGGANGCPVIAEYESISVQKGDIILYYDYKGSDTLTVGSAVSMRGLTIWRYTR